MRADVLKRGWDGISNTEVDEIETIRSKTLDTEALRSQLRTHLLGSEDRVVYIPTVGSTNDQAMNLARSGAKEGLVVLAESQTAGKGRLGRHWVDKFGHDILLSALLYPVFTLPHLVMIASLAVIEAIADSCNIVATIKWPNDILINTNKVAGILIETSRDQRGQLFAIIGIGINVNGLISNYCVNEHESESPQSTQGLTKTATTLEAECGHVVSREALIVSLLEHLEDKYLAVQQEAKAPVALAQSATSRLIREQWRKHLSTLGRNVEVRQGDVVLTGIAEDVNENGELLLRRHSGETVSITWGDIGYPTEELTG